MWHYKSYSVQPGFYVHNQNSSLNYSVKYLFYAYSNSLEQCRLFSSIEESAPFIYRVPFLSLCCSPGAVNLKKCHQESVELFPGERKGLCRKGFSGSGFLQQGLLHGFLSLGCCSLNIWHVCLWVKDTRLHGFSLGQANGTVQLLSVAPVSPPAGSCTQQWMREFLWKRTKHSQFCDVQKMILCAAVRSC